MEQHGKRERRSWAGEGLWSGRASSGRTVEVGPAEGKHFRAVGKAGAEPAFDVSLRQEQLFRFRRQMERAGAVVHGMPSWTEPDPDTGERRRRPQGPIGTDGSDKPPPTGPKMLGPDDNPMLLMADAGERQPSLPPQALGQGAVGRAPALQERLARPESLGDPGANPNVLALQRWGVIAPQGPAGDELLELIRPLMDLRAEQQGTPVRTYRGPAGGGDAEASRWFRTTYLAEAVPEHERPSYLLILGDLHQVSAELQQRLAVSAQVGRLCFDDAAGYRAYVEKVLRHERTPPAQDARAIFFTTHDGSLATSTGYDSLVLPALELCDDVPRGPYPVREVLEVGTPEEWSAARLRDAVRDGGPNVLFTLSHGLGPPRGGWTSSDRRRQLQGAMAFGQGQPLTAEHVGRGPFLPNGAWFFLACLSAGTPARSAYRPWLEKLKADGEFSGSLESVLAALPGPGEQPFIAALPRAALANPEGPLAIIGHLDLAWTYAFQDAHGARRPARFVEVMKQLWTGRRVGVAFRALLRHASEVEGELLGLAQEDAERLAGSAPSPEAVHRGHLWMSRHDLAGYLLLGDPAVRVAPGRD